MAVILHQFQSSHFNEKARWALTYKGIDHTRKSYLPGPHRGPMKKLSGQGSTPVLEWDKEVIAGSGAIVEFLENKSTERPLFPSEPAARQAVIDWCRRLDEELGPAARTVVWAALIDSGSYPVRVFGKGQPALKLGIYRLLFPFIKPLIKQANGVNAENITRSEAVVDTWLDEIAEATRPTGYLVGDRFSAADLTAAALIAPLANPPHPDMAKPEPVAPAVLATMARYTDHPAIAWVEKQYREQRG